MPGLRLQSIKSRSLQPSVGRFSLRVDKSLEPERMTNGLQLLYSTLGRGQGIQRSGIWLLGTLAYSSHARAPSFPHDLF